MTIKQYFREIFILHTAITTGAILFLGIGLFLGPIGKEQESGQLLKLMQTGILGLMLVSGGLISFLFPRIKQKIELKDNLSEKLSGYRTWVIIRAALLEVVALFCGVGVLLTGKKMLFVLGLGFVGFLIYFIPRKEKITQEIVFSQEDLQTLNDENATIS